MEIVLKKKVAKKNKRIGRGMGSGKGGHTVGKGMKGQRSRSGYKIPRPGFEGGQMPLSRRLPKLKGFRRAYFKSKVKNFVINLSDLENIYKDGDEVTVETLFDKGMDFPESKRFQIKILGDGELTKKLTIVNLNVSKSAQDKVEKAGGKVEERKVNIDLPIEQKVENTDKTQKDENKKE